MRRPAAAALAALLILLTLALGAAPASAHAVLEASSPGDGARLDEAPTDVRLEFNEPVSADLGGVRVFAADGDRVDEGETRVDGGVVTVGLADLDDGAYAVTYRVVSEDGHPVQGGLVFSVGDATADPALLSQFFDEGANRTWEVAAALVRFVAYAGVLLAAGTAFFLTFVHDGGAGTPRVRRLSTGAAVVGAIGLIAALPLQAALATGTGLGAIAEDGVLSSVLGDGVGWSIGLGLIGLGLLVAGRGRRVPVVVGLLLGAGAFALAGHTRSSDVEALAVLAAGVHAVVAAVWWGGLVALALVLRPRHDEADHTSSAGVVTGFSRAATVSVLLVGATGLVLTWSEVRAVRALGDTAYGWTLLAKVAVVGVVALIGAHNRFRVVPAIERASGARAWSLLRRSVAVEALALVLAVGLTAVLVNVTPARTEAGVGGLFSETVPLVDNGTGEEIGTVNVVVDPNRAGRNTIHFYFYDPDGRAVDLAEEVTVSLTLPANDLGPIVREPVRAGPAHFQIDGDELVTGGRWDIAVDARLSRFEAATAEVEALVGG